MSLDLGETIVQLDRVTQNLGQGYNYRQERLTRLIAEAAKVSPAIAQERTRRFYDPFLAAQVVDTLLGAIEPLPAPEDWVAASVDGSHIDVDRHLPVPCYLVNLGGCVLTYGSRAAAQFFSRPHLAARQDELYLHNPQRASEEEAVTGNLLGLHRTVRELTALLEVVKECPPDLPVLALVDGTLVLWGLAGHGYRDFVREHIIRDGLLPVLEGVPAVILPAQSRTGGLRVIAPQHRAGQRHPPLPLHLRFGPLPRILQQSSLRARAL